METDPKKSGLNAGTDVFGGGNGVGGCVLRFKKQSRPGDSRRTEKTNTPGDGRANRYTWIFVLLFNGFCFTNGKSSVYFRQFGKSTFQKINISSNPSIPQWS